MNEKDVHIGTFGAHLRMLREARKLTQTGLARLTNLHFSAISRFEHNRCKPSTRSIETLADALNVSAQSLLEFDVRHDRDCTRVGLGFVADNRRGALPGQLDKCAIVQGTALQSCGEGRQLSRSKRSASKESKRWSGG